MARHADILGVGFFLLYAVANTIKARDFVTMSVDGNVFAFTRKHTFAQSKRLRRVDPCGSARISSPKFVRPV